jgi:SNF2 family DNA or RNA helicase
VTFSGTLHPYQVTDAAVMVDVGKVLAAYDMGTGKTVLAISTIEELMDAGKIREPGLVLVLSSLKYQWATMIEQFSGGTSKALVIDGPPKTRLNQYAQARDWMNTGVDYIVMGYTQVVDDWDQVKTLPRGFIIADEVTALKSFKAQRSRKTKVLGKRVKYKYGLTATPIENGKPEELFSIMEFVDPTVLGSYPDFDALYVVRNQWGWPDHYINLDHLFKRLQGVMIRKSQTDPDVAPFMPDTIHRDPILVRLDTAGRALYTTVSDELQVDLEEMQAYMDMGMDPESQEMNTLKGAIMSKLTALRMLCDHPELLTISATNSNAAATTTGSKYAADLLSRGLLPTHPKTPKLDAVVQYVSDHLEVPGHKAVIFSVFVPTLDILATRLSRAMNSKEKEANKVRFQTDPNVRVLISSDAGGYGVDLPQANLLVNYDQPWAHGAAKQRNGRIQRASSKWPTVTIQDFLVQGSVEVRQHEMLQGKGSVASAILDGKGFDKDGGLSLSPTSLRKFLKVPGL